MNPWFAKAVILLANVAIIVIRAPHGHRSRTVRVVKSRRGPLEAVLLTFALGTFFLTMVWIATPLFAFADYPLRPLPFVAGVLTFATGQWIFYRSHADLGTNWSVTLELRERHRLVTHGIYRWMRHPMYLALLLIATGQALALPNWLVGPSYLVAMLLLVALRLGPEERMMREQFGKDYEAYAATTKRLVPGVW
jgi:protein-S-isoprenylcysteine O-methyltransferase Ste14